MKKLKEIYDRFRFLLIAIPFLVLLFPFIGRGWSYRAWETMVILTQCPFIAVANSVHPMKTPPTLFTGVVALACLTLADVFAQWSYLHVATWLPCVGIIALMLFIEVMVVEVLGMAMARR